jgi:hypothetical protein
MERRTQKTYLQVIGVYSLIILIVVLGFTLLSVLAFPYYISPLTYRNGGQPQGEALMVLFGTLSVIMLIGVSLLERGPSEWGYALILVSLIFGALILWDLYGFSAIRQVSI